MHFKKPICASNEDYYRKFINNTIDYIKKLKVLEDGVMVPVLLSKRGTGFLGFVIGLKNLLELYSDLCINNSNPSFHYIASYKYSQDHLELYFSTIRMQGGYNNNPSARQFRSAYRKTQLRLEIKASKRMVIAYPSRIYLC